MRPYYQFDVRARGPLRPLIDREACADLWSRLRNVFSRVAACVLMPNHFHLVSATTEPKDASTQLSVELRAWARRYFPGLSVWNTPYLSDPIPDSQHLKRRIRYVHLNPCRARLVADPLQWEWSTHRDLVGAVAPSWIDLSDLAKDLRMPSAILPRKLHEYISGDPSTHPNGTPWLIPSQKPHAIMDLSMMTRAVAVATRSTSNHGLKIRAARKMTAQISKEWKIAPTHELAATLGIKLRQLQNLRSQDLSPDDRLVMQAALQTFCDPRLLY